MTSYEVNNRPTKYIRQCEVEEVLRRAYDMLIPPAESST